MHLMIDLLKKKRIAYSSMAPHHTRGTDEPREAYGRLEECALMRTENYGWLTMSS